MIISTTITKNNEDIIRDALGSAKDIVDTMLIIDTGCSDKTIEIAKQVAGDKFVYAKFDWCNDFAAARNFALGQAAKILDGKHGWALTLDTDERLIVSDKDILFKELSSFKDTVGLCSYVDHSYSKERFFKIPLASESGWAGATHEGYFTGSGRSSVMRSVLFHELAKNKDQLVLKFVRDESILRRELEKEPSNNRYRFYLAETLRNLGKEDESVFFHEQSFYCATWDEEKAWSAYRCAEYYVSRSDYGKVKEWCLKGLSAHGGFAEHAWLMSWVLYQEASYKQSIYWARIAKAIAETEKDPLLSRIGFRYTPAYQDGPREVEKWARTHI